MDDREIIELFRQRDQAAIRETAAAYGARLFQLAVGILKNGEDAEEIVNDTYFKAWKTIPPQNPRFLFAYLAKVCRFSAFGRLLSRFLETLSEENRLFFMRRYWYADSIRAVSERCGVSESRVKVSLHRTRKKLRDYLESEDITV